MIFSLLVSTLVSLIAVNVYASGDHGKNEKPKAAEASDHSNEDSHNHEEEEAEGGNVGPEKGIVEASERSGFKLSPEALKNFELKLKKLSGDGPWSVPNSVIVHSGEEVNVFRLRNGFFKRIDFHIIKKSESEITIDSGDLREGDELVISGLGFLRIAELAAFGGVAHGHSH